MSLPSLVGLKPTQLPEKRAWTWPTWTPTPPSDQGESPGDSDNTVTAATTHNHEKTRKKGKIEDAQHADSASSSTHCSWFALQSSTVVN